MIVLASFLLLERCVLDQFNDLVELDLRLLRDLTDELSRLLWVSLVLSQQQRDNPLKTELLLLHDLIKAKTFNRCKVDQVVFEGDHALDEHDLVFGAHFEPSRLRADKVKPIAAFVYRNEAAKKLGHLLVHHLLEIYWTQGLDLSEDLGSTLQQFVWSFVVSLSFGKLARPGEQIEEIHCASSLNAIKRIDEHDV